MGGPFKKVHILYVRQSVSCTYTYIYIYIYVCAPCHSRWAHSAHPIIHQPTVSPHLVAPSDYTALTDEVVGPLSSNVTRGCFTVTIVRDSVCEGEVGSDGVPEEEVFSAVVRSEEGSGVEVVASGRVATITIQDSAVCSKFHRNNHSSCQFFLCVVQLYTTNEVEMSISCYVCSNNPFYQ